MRTLLLLLLAAATLAGCCGLPECSNQPVYAMPNAQQRIR